jgi:hypothetical protein
MHQRANGPEPKNHREKCSSSVLQPRASAGLCKSGQLYFSENAFSECAIATVQEKTCALKCEGIEGA